MPEAANFAARQGRTSDRVAVGEMLARAFMNDPAVVWMNPDAASRSERMPHSFAKVFDSDAGGMRWVSPGCEAATLWRRAGRTDRVSWRDRLRWLWPFFRTGSNALQDPVANNVMVRATALHGEIERRKPASDHWYLHVAGCDPAAQGKGYGAAAIRAGLAHTAGLPAYLETANEQNLPFYEKFGFAVVEEWHVPGGGPQFWSMLRPGD